MSSNKSLSPKKEQAKKDKTENITRILAIILCFVIIFGFSIKLIFF